MPGSTPTIYNPTPPGGQIGVSEAKLPQGSAPGDATSNTWSLKITAADGVGDLTIGGYRAISAGVFTAGSAVTSYGRLNVLSYDAATGDVAFNFTLTAPIDSATTGPSRYGDLRSFDVRLTDRDGDVATSTITLQIIDDNTVKASPDTATVVAGGSVSGNLLRDGPANIWSADGPGGVNWTEAGVVTAGGGPVTVTNVHGTFTVNYAGDYTYTPAAGLAAGSTHSYVYQISDHDGDTAQTTITFTIEEKASGAATPGDDQMSGATIFGGAGNDTLTANVDHSYLRGEDGDDRIIGSNGFDDLHGNTGNDTVMGGLGDDWVVGGQGSDQLFGEAGFDVVLGNIGDDTVEGGDAGDWVRGGQGNDLVRGGAGDDFIAGDRGDDTLTGGTGADRFHSFGDAGLDRITDFNFGEGDRLNLLPGSAWSAHQSGADVVVDVTAAGSAGAQVVLVGVQLSSLSDGWIWLG